MSPPGSSSELNGVYTVATSESIELTVPDRFRPFGATEEHGPSMTTAATTTSGQLTYIYNNIMDVVRVLPRQTSKYRPHFFQHMITIFVHLAQ